MPLSHDLDYIGIIISANTLTYQHKITIDRLFIMKADRFSRSANLSSAIFPFCMILTLLHYLEKHAKMFLIFCLEFINLDSIQKASLTIVKISQKLIKHTERLLFIHFRLITLVQLSNYFIAAYRLFMLL
jgi:hypothetical protein